MQLHACLNSEVAAFDFRAADLEAIAVKCPGVTLHVHENHESLLKEAENAEVVLAWEFRQSWYSRFPHLRAVFTPAAGRDWVADDPRGRVEVIHGTFHGRLLGESLLGAILFMNRRMPAMIRNFERREWDRDIQKDCRLLAGQTVLILGLGNIGSECARILQPLGPRIIGIKRNPANTLLPLEGIEVRPVTELDATLPEADHVAVILPGDAGTDRILDARRLHMCKPGVHVYNFGRGNAVASDDIVKAADHIGGAFLDVTDEEPLPPESSLWSMENIMITPHSSCIYREYRESFTAEVIGHLLKQ